jgi:RING-box protein 1
MADTNVCTRIPMTIESIDVTAIWKFNVANDTCSICKESLTTPCAACITDSDSITEIDCKTSRGACNHGFHYHCIMRHLKISETCPVDQTPWNWGVKDMGLNSYKKHRLRKKK